MKIAILTQFSRGDVQPFAALARALTQAGHNVVIGAPASSVSLVEPFGERTVALDDVARRLITQPMIRRSLEANHRGPRGKLLGIRHMRLHRALTAALYDDMTDVVDKDTDVVVHHALLPAHEVAERIKAPAVPVFIDPFWIPTRIFPDPEFPFRLPPSFNRATFGWMNLRRRVARGGTDPWRRDTLGLPPRRDRFDVLRRPDGSPATALQAFSRHVLPAPPDFPETVHTTGYWFLPAARTWTPPARLTEFLAAGEPPVYVGFGSAVGADPRQRGRLVTTAVRLARVRAVVVTGWGGIEIDESHDICRLDDAPFDWLFPRMAAIVHHGGGGTSSAAFASGRPQVVCPFVISGQRFWSRRVHESGVAPAPLPQYRLTATELAAAIRTAVDDPVMAARAAEIGGRVRAENGTATAVRLIEEQVS